MNILWLVDHLGYKGIIHGAGKYYLDVLTLLNKNKINVILCVLRERDQLTKLFEYQGIKIRHFTRSKFDPRALSDLIKVIKEEKIELVHSHGYGSDNFGRIAGALLKIPTIIHAHDENSNYPWYQNLADLLLKGVTYGAIAISESVKKSCVVKRRISLDKLSVMRNGILLKNFVPVKQEIIQQEKEQLGIKPCFKVVGTVARLREEKGIKYLIESVPEILEVFPNTIFLIAGDGPLREELQDLSIRYGVQKKVIFAGFCQNIRVILSLIDIFVASSLTEGLGLGILEAMAMGKPIIATNVGGIKEILKDKETGYLVPAKNSKALADKVIHLISDENEARRLVINSRKESQKYDIGLYIQKLEKYYFEVIRGCQ
jgi:glycosyltransferase involved in cell wall biosynthesis